MSDGYGRKAAAKRETCPYHHESNSDHLVSQRVTKSLYRVVHSDEVDPRQDRYACKIKGEIQFVGKFQSVAMLDVSYTQLAVTLKVIRNMHDERKTWSRQVALTRLHVKF